MYKTGYICIPIDMQNLTTFNWGKMAPSLVSPGCLDGLVAWGSVIYIGRIHGYTAPQLSTSSTSM